jgi:transcriptional regulator with XRE-family HTH domain
MTYNSKLLPTVGPTTMAEMMLRGPHTPIIRQYDLSSIFKGIITQKNQQKRTALKTSSGNPHGEIASGTPAFYAWRIAHGWDTLDVARQLPLTMKRYAQIERGIKKPNFEEMRTFCKLFRLHPIEIINFDADNLTTDEIMLALNAYKNPASYNFTHAACHWDLHEDLDRWVDHDMSYDNLEDSLHELEDESAPEDLGLITVLSKLLINDGNKAMGIDGVLNTFDSAFDHLNKIAFSYAQDVENILEKMKTLSEIANTKGKEMFQHRWIEYRDFTLGLLQQAEEGEGTREFAHEMFMKEIPARVQTSDNQKDELFALIITIGKEHGRNTYLDAKGSLASQQAEKINGFVNQNEALLTQYAIRQAIISQTNIGKPQDDKEHSLYTKGDPQPIQTNSPILKTHFLPK